MNRRVIARVNSLILNHLILDRLHAIEMRNRRIIIRHSHSAVPYTITERHDIDHILHAVQINNSTTNRLTKIIMLRRMMLNKILTRDRHRLIFVSLQLSVRLRDRLIATVRRTLQRLNMNTIETIRLGRLTLFNVLKSLNITIRNRIITILDNINALTIFRIVLNGQAKTIFVKYS